MAMFKKKDQSSKVAPSTNKLTDLEEKEAEKEKELRDLKKECAGKEAEVTSLDEKLSEVRKQLESKGDDNCNLMNKQTMLALTRQAAADDRRYILLKINNAARELADIEKEKEAIPGVTYEDVDSAITYVGVISALLLSFSVAIFTSVPKEEFDSADLYYVTVYSEEFRNYIDPDMTLRNELGIPKYLKYTGETYELDNRLIEYLSPLRNFSSRITVETFRHWVDNNWPSVAVADNRINGGIYLPSQEVLSFGVGSTMLLIIPVLYSTLASMSLVLLNTRSHPKTLRRWFFLSKFVLLLNYVLLAVGCGFMFCLIGFVVVVRLPQIQEHLYFWSLMHFVFVPLVALIIILPGAVHARVWWQQKRDLAEEAAEEERKLAARRASKQQQQQAFCEAVINSELGDSEG